MSKRLYVCIWPKIVAYMTEFLKVYTGIFEIFDIDSGVSSLIFGNIFGYIFGNFRETFGGPKPLFYFGLVSKSESPKHPKYRESRKAENFRQMHGPSLDCSLFTEDFSFISEIIL